MNRPHRTPLLAGLLVATLPSVLPALLAQTVSGPAGHWEATIQAQGTDKRVEVDLTTDGTGGLAGTISVPADHLNRLPLGKVAVDGTSITFYAREDQPFTGVLSADGTSMSGDIVLSGYTIPMRFSRIGEARIEAPSTSAAIGRELEGIWNGTLDLNGTTLRLLLRMTNRPDGTSTGSIINLDEGKLEVPLSRIAQTDSNVTLELKIVGGSYVGVLGKGGTELAGTYTQGALTAPLTFKRSAPTENNK
jgi:hypothetical protein